MISSYWIESTPETSYPELDGDVAVDVAVIGGGITGITAALLLKRAGKSVALMEMKRLARGATGYTTAKVTAGHSLVYETLEKRFGAEGARQYARANSAAIEEIRSLAAELAPDCDLETKANYAYTEKRDSVAQIKSEVEAARRAGLSAELVTESTLPFPIAGAIRIADQAQFHPRKYLLPLAAAIPGDGSHVFEQTRALDVESAEPCTVKTARGTVRARDVIVATHLPFEDRALLFALAHPQRSYAVAAPIAPADAPDGMFISVDQPVRSVRTTPDDGRVLLIVGGEGHKTGQADTRQPYERLESWGAERFGLDEFPYRWATHDYVSVDKVPFVGRLVAWGGHVWTATGYGKWGMTNGTAAAMALRDFIVGRPNDWSGLYSRSRIRSFARRSFFSENGNVAKHFFGDRLGIRGAEALEALAPGDGAVVRVAGESLAVARREDGSLAAVSPRCTHLGCFVAWNGGEQTWDCPCHGSRYLPDGTVIQGPAVDDLAPRQLPASIDSSTLTRT